MTRTDDDHRVAAIIKGLEQRIADLEEQDRSTGTPNLLRSETDRIVIDDSTLSVEEITLDTAKWNDIGLGEPSDDTISPPVVSLETTTPAPTPTLANTISMPVSTLSTSASVPDLSTTTTGGYSEGGYSEGPYGDPTTTDGGTTMTDGGGSSVFGMTSTTGWHTGTWGAYSAGDLIVVSGETHTIPTGTVEPYIGVRVDGILEADGVLETE